MEEEVEWLRFGFNFDNVTPRSIQGCELTEEVHSWTYLTDDPLCGRPGVHLANFRFLD